MIKNNRTLYDQFNIQQKASYHLIQNDLRFIYTVFQSAPSNNFFLAFMPYFGTIIDGAEDWVKAYNNSQKSKINIPTFDSEEELYYGKMRSAIKMFEQPYEDMYEKLRVLYEDSEKHFASKCKKIAKLLRLYDIFGVDFVDEKYCGNTILNSYYIPDFKYGNIDGEKIKLMSIIAGKYVDYFNATRSYKVDNTIAFSVKDYGGFSKSPFGNSFSHKFVLFCLLCQLQFVSICVEQFVLEECTTKLRIEYLQYYYTSKIVPQINEILHTNFTFNTKFVCKKFRHSMAHYKVGVSLKPDEVIPEKMFYGLVEKHFQCDYFELKSFILYILNKLSNEIKCFLNL